MNEVEALKARVAQLEGELSEANTKLTTLGTEYAKTVEERNKLATDFEAQTKEFESVKGINSILQTLLPKTVVNEGKVENKKEAIDSVDDIDNDELYVEEGEN